MITTVDNLKAGQTVEVSIDLIDPKDKMFCLRTSFKTETMSSSLQTLGQIHPMTTRVKGNRLQAVTGWRRYLALKANDAKTIVVTVIDKSDTQCRLISLAENLDREEMTAAEKYKALDGLIKDGVKTTELMEKLHWGKSYANYIKKISQFPSVVNAIKEDKFGSISTAAELAEQLSGKKIDNENLINHAIAKITDGSWRVNDIGLHLKREKDQSERQPAQPSLSKKLIESSGKKNNPFKSEWQPSWEYFDLLEEKNRFLAEIKKIDVAMKKRRGI